MARHSGRRLIAALSIGTVAVACGNGDGEDASRTTSTRRAAEAMTSTIPCGPGGRTIELEGVEVREFCGNARATVTLGGEADEPAGPDAEADTGEAAAPPDAEMGAGETLEFVGGECSRHAAWLAVNLGVEILESGEAASEVTDPRFRSFSLLVGRHPGAPEQAPEVSADGNYQDGVITFSVPGASWAVDDMTITLVATRTAGLFTGMALPSRGSRELVPVRGVFTCDHETVALEEVTDLVETGNDG